MSVLKPALLSVSLAMSAAPATALSLNLFGSNDGDPGLLDILLGVGNDSGGSPASEDADLTGSDPDETGTGIEIELGLDLLGGGDNGSPSSAPETGLGLDLDLALDGVSPIVETALDGVGDTVGTGMAEDGNGGAEAPSVSAVPLPAAGLLLVAGLGALGYARYRRG